MCAVARARMRSGSAGGAFAADEQARRQTEHETETTRARRNGIGAMAHLRGGTVGAAWRDVKRARRRPLLRVSGRALARLISPFPYGSGGIRSAPGTARTLRWRRPLLSIP